MSFYVALRDFFEAGGPVLWAILLATLLMWFLIIERLWFFKLDFPVLAKRYLARWHERNEVKSWAAHRIREAFISELSLKSRRYLPVINALMAALPLLGLLGTVTGMIQVFDVMAITGTGNARAMAGGVSAATIPTMCGLVAALSGLYFSIDLKRRARHAVVAFEDELNIEHSRHA